MSMSSFVNKLRRCKGQKYQAFIGLKTAGASGWLRCTCTTVSGPFIAALARLVPCKKRKPRPTQRQDQNQNQSQDQKTGTTNTTKALRDNADNFLNMNVQLTQTSGVRLAVEGCGHGTLHAIYASVEESCKRKGWPGVDLLIIGGDFQAVRNAFDLNCVSMPARYRAMGDFHEYYSGQRKAPYLTIFVGGNHEASNYLFELYYGGWVAPNIYYMGAANVLKFGPLRIAGLSGIWKGYNYRKTHHERLPYNESDMKSIYHVRELDIRKLLQIRTQVDIGISHDWPSGVEWEGNWKQLFRFKPYFEDDARNKTLGSTAAKQAMDLLRPKWWFSAHLHCKYVARIDHARGDDVQKPVPNGSHAASRKQGSEAEVELDYGDDGKLPGSAAANSNEIDLGLDEDEEDVKEKVPHPTNGNEIDLELDEDLEKPSKKPSNGDLQSANPSLPKATFDNPPIMSTDEARATLPDAFRRPAAPEPLKRSEGITNQVTKFLALDKCLPGKHFLQLLELPSESNLDSMRPLKLEYDREWLSITRALALDEPIEVGDPTADVPRARSQTEYVEAIDKRRAWVDEHISDAELVVPENFEIIAPVYDNGNWNLPQYAQALEYPNPQTARFCEMLHIANPFELSESERARRQLAAAARPDPNARAFDQGGRGDNFRGGYDRGRGRGRGRGGRGRGRFRTR